MRYLYSLLVVACMVASTSLKAQILYSEESTSLGFSGVTYGNGTLGGGITFFDFDDDGWDDITVTTGSGEPVRFFKNNAGTFTEVFFNAAQHLSESKTAIWVDFDNDGDYDLHISSSSHTNQLFENDGNMQFTDITAAAGLDLPSNLAWGGSWGDYNNDGWLDMFQSSRDTTDPTIHNRLLRNNQDGTFTEVTIPAGISTDDTLTFCSAFFDYNNDGWQDIYLANDRPWHPNILYHNNGDGTYSDVSEASGSDVEMNAMTTTIGDYNHDGWFDIYVTNTTEGNGFLVNNGDNTFTDIAAANGTLMESIGWGAVFLDSDNDTDMDLYVCASISDPNIALTGAFYENDGSGNYTIPANAGFHDDLAASFGNAMGDINNDGYPDIAVLNFGPDDIYIWRNECPDANNWLKVKLVGVESNRMGVGSVIEISVDGEKQYNYTLCGEGFLGQNSAWEFFGIGDATSIDYIKVTWLSGLQDMITNPDINTHLVIEEGSALSVDDSVLSASVRLAPNPASGLVSVSIPSDFRSSTLTISDIQGRVLHSVELTDEIQDVDVSKYSGGLYFFHFQKGNTTITKKLVVR